MKRIIIVAALLFAVPALAQQAASPQPQDRNIAQANHALALLEAQVDQTNHALDETRAVLATLVNENSSQKARLDANTKSTQDLQDRVQWWEKSENRQWVDGKANAP